MTRYERKPIKPRTERIRQPRIRRSLPPKTLHDDPRMALFWTLLCQDLELTDVVIPVKFTREIRDTADKPLKVLQNGTRTCGFMRYHPGKGYEVQVLSSLGLRQTLKTLAHEARHVFQHKYKWWSGWNWQGERISKLTRYEDLPWERDATNYARYRLDYLALASGFDIDNEF